MGTKCRIDLSSACFTRWPGTLQPALPLLPAQMATAMVSFGTLVALWLVCNAQMFRRYWPGVQMRFTQCVGRGLSNKRTVVAAACTASWPACKLGGARLLGWRNMSQVKRACPPCRYGGVEAVAGGELDSWALGRRLSVQARKLLFGVHMLAVNGISIGEASADWLPIIYWCLLVRQELVHTGHGQHLSATLPVCMCACASCCKLGASPPPKWQRWEHIMRRPRIQCPTSSPPRIGRTLWCGCCSTAWPGLAGAGTLTRRMACLQRACWMVLTAARSVWLAAG